MHTCVYIYIQQLSCFRAPTWWFIELIVAFLILWQFFSGEKDKAQKYSNFAILYDTKMVADGYKAHKALILRELLEANCLNYYYSFVIHLSKSVHVTNMKTNGFLSIYFFSQHVIPQRLLDHYVSMPEPAKAQTIDTEIARHCAFSLPAVALTLGRNNWPCLRDTYELLASDMQVLYQLSIVQSCWCFG